MEMKETLQIGRTKFPMRAGLPKNEPLRQADWFENEVYEKRQEKNAGKPAFVLHDGPPFANGNIHIGHALNKITKDVIVRSKSMMGFRAPYVPGWDTHGLPVEQALTNQGVDRKSMTTAEYRKMCMDFSLSQVDTQREDFKRLGVAGDWDDPYITLTKDYEAAQIRVFGAMADKGYIYRGQKPIYWSPSSESALAEAEIEYQDVRSPAIYVAFDLKDGKDKLAEDTSLVIWTTTPWTIPANLAIAVHPDFIYAVVKVSDKKYVVARDMLENIAEHLDWTGYEIVQEIKGSEMEYMVAKHPIYDRDSLVVNADYVTLEDGTGLVHTAPGHGDDDYQTGLKYDLDILSPVDGQGYFTDEAPGLEGVFYDDGNKWVTGQLTETGQLLKMDFITHSYPHDWRTKKPVIFRATPQWFASIDDFREEILKAIKEVDWIRKWGEPRIYNMVKDRGDWVISRQRAWGVPLPIFYAEDGTPILEKEVTDHVAELFAEHGSNVWFEREAKDLLPEGYSHEASPNGEFTKETDIMDVWFDSGSSHEAVLRGREELTFPADMYLEGSDQYRGWFNSSLTTSVAINGCAPYKSVLSQGFVLDGKGRKMSKSIGNTIDPNKVADQMGADIIRLWTASVDTESDVRVSMDILKQVSEVYRKIRNTIRFLLANTTDFDPQENAIAYDDLNPVDQYQYNVLQEVTEKALDAYDRYDFQTVYREINNYCITVLSNFYLDFAKDVVYIEAEDSHDRRSEQTVFYQIAVNLAKLLTPIIPHTTEEIWEYLKEEEDYVQLADMPEVQYGENAAELFEKWNVFMDFRDDVLKALEVAREDKLIGKSFEAKLTVYVTEEMKEILDSLDTNLQRILIVSELVVEDLDQAPEEALKFDDLAILVEKKSGEVCERCRITSETVGTFEDAPTVCDRCHAILQEHYPEILEK